MNLVLSGAHLYHKPDNKFINITWCQEFINITVSLWDRLVFGGQIIANFQKLLSLLVIDHSGWYFDRRFIIAVVSCVCILPLCIPKKLKVISYSRY